MHGALGSLKASMVRGEKQGFFMAFVEKVAGQNMKIICFSEIQWRYVRTRKQHILERLPADWEILFLSSVVKGKPNNFRPLREGRITHVCVPIFKNIPQRWLRSLLALPVVRFFWNVVIWVWLRAIFIATGFEGGQRVFYVSNIYYAAVIRFLGRDLMLYDCNDNHLAFPDTPSWAARYFASLVKSADVVIAVTKRLEEILKETGASKVHIVGNGVDYELFRSAAESGTPEEMRSLRRPIIGYSGAVARWFDMELLDRVAESFPEASVVLVGPVFREREDELRSLIDRRRNVHVLGPKPYERLGAYIASMDVCIVPLARNELMRSADPNKIYEYAACAKPIVTMRHSQEISSLEGLIYIVDSDEEFVRAIDRALEKGAAVDRLLAFARDHSWQSRADSIAGLIEEALEKKSSKARRN